MSTGMGPDDRLRERLRALREDPPGDDFEARLHRRLVATGPPDAPGRWERWRGVLHGGGWRWPAAALGGAAVALAVFLAVRGAGEGTDLAEVATRVPVSKVAVVRLELTAKVAVSSATLRISLPEGLVFWSEGQALAQRSFEWTQPLAAGNNEFPIAVRGQRPGRYRVHLTARVGAEDVEYDVPLEVTRG